MNSCESNILINFIKNKAVFMPAENSTKIFLHFLYNHFNLYDNLLKHKKILRKIVSSTNRLSSADNSYFPRKIQNYINGKKAHKITYKCKLYSREVVINFLIFTKNVDVKYYDEMSRYAFLILYLFDQFSNKQCNNTLTIDIYMTPFRRELPSKINEPIGPLNVNGGFTLACVRDGSITIYRQQEWFKVLIHEAMHSFCFDFATQDQNSLNKKLKSIFPIDSKFNIFETYSEMWAELINIAFVAFELNKMKNPRIENFIHYFEYLMSMERYFCFFQAYKILNHYGLSYTDILKSGNKYKEESNVFAYYINKCILYLDYNQFIKLCHIRNSHFFNFSHKKSDIIEFYNFIKKNYKNKKLIALFKEAEIDYKNLDRSSDKHLKFLKDNLRMTSIEL